MTRRGWFGRTCAAVGAFIATRWHRKAKGATPANVDRMFAWPWPTRYGPIMVAGRDSLTRPVLSCDASGKPEVHFHVSTDKGLTWSRYTVEK